MNPDMVAELLKGLLRESLLLAAPILIGAMVLSFILSLLQTLTNLQEQSLTTVPRLVLVGALMLAGMPWFLGRLVAYTLGLLTDFQRYLG